MNTKADPRIPFVPISIGELFDKITILEIKLSKLSDENGFIAKELDLLQGIVDGLELSGEIHVEVGKLKQVNEELWMIEEGKRDHERRQSFDKEFIQLARDVYLKNDLRAEIKRQINSLTASGLQEVKSHFKNS